MLTVIRIGSGERIAWDAAAAPGIALLNFAIVTEGWAPLTMPDSLAATPACYLYAAAARFRRADAGGPVLLLNPFVEFSAEFWSVVPDILQRFAARAGAGVIGTFEDIPLGYWVSAGAWDALSPAEMLALRFLSCSSAHLDQLLLDRVLPGGSSLVSLPLMDTVSAATGFFLAGAPALYRSIAAHALSSFGARTTSQGVEAGITAVMPYHAGDTLLFCKALAETKHPVKRLVVNRQFADIAERIVPNIECIQVDVPAIGRRRAEDRIPPVYESEIHFFFESILTHVPDDAPYAYFRPVRLYNRSHFHMLDQWKFALTSDPFVPLPEQEEHISSVPGQDKSVLIHFEGGWHLRVYPKDRQLELIRRLHLAGFRTTVLGSQALEYPCPWVEFHSTEQVTELIASHAIVVGLDSFPGHWSVHALQHPTVMLFSTTHPDNVGVPKSPAYRALHNGLSCSPCTARDICPRFGGGVCRNFVEPAKIVAEVVSMYCRVYERAT